MKEPPADVAAAVRLAVRETLAGAIRAWVGAMTTAELNQPDLRDSIRPLLVELVRRELQAALDGGSRRRGRRRRK
ncbi:MAG: hypothetical protein HY744_20895 [Deltaproteobacteria bacterium]|nr:hypothetical protein [Deltaproteobacteria bacterium]